MQSTENLRCRIAGIDLCCPVILAAGTCGVLDEFGGVIDLSRVGAVVTKSITRLPRQGNPTWRIIENDTGMLNAIGLANIGLDDFLEHVAPRVARVPTRVLGSVAGFSVDDYVQVAASMNEIEGLAGVELNVSCPNVHGGTEFGVDPGALRELVGAVRAVTTRLPMIVKLAPIALGNPGIVAIARSAIDGAGVTGGPGSRPGADALTISNTIPAMSIDVRTRRPRLANVTGGLSGSPLHPIALKLVYDAYRLVARDAGIPIIGAGGVTRWRHAAEFILAGASAVQMGTALFADPRSPYAVARGLARWVRDQRCASIRDLVGSLVMPTG